MAAERGRYAPSPTGAIHLGNARTALLGWLDARAAGAAFVMRVEDLDRARVLADAEARLFDDLRWLGLDWDEGPDVGGARGPYRQSERGALYDAAVERLLATGRAFRCACSRLDLARAASAPHPDEEGPRYPGTCRGRPAAEVEARAFGQGRACAIRFDGRDEAIGFHDEVRGAIAPEPVDDFVIRRADGTAAYQLAVVVDDAAMGVTRVVRADDLSRSTPRQLALYAALDLAAPAFAHVPLVLTPSGDRLSKRTRPASLGELRGHGVDPRAVVGALGASAGLCAATDRPWPRDLVAEFSLARVAREPAVVDMAAFKP